MPTPPNNDNFGRETPVNVPTPRTIVPEVATEATTTTTTTTEEVSVELVTEAAGTNEADAESAPKAPVTGGDAGSFFFRVYRILSSLLVEVLSVEKT